jgi:hypothetical protein
MKKHSVIPDKFARITSHLRGKDFRWLREDLGLPDMPDAADLGFGNDNPSRS